MSSGCQLGQQALYPCAHHWLPTCCLLAQLLAALRALLVLRLQLPSPLLGCRPSLFLLLAPCLLLCRHLCCHTLQVRRPMLALRARPILLAVKLLLLLLLMMLLLLLLLLLLVCEIDGPWLLLWLLLIIIIVCLLLYRSRKTRIA